MWNLTYARSHCDENSISNTFTYANSYANPNAHAHATTCTGLQHR